MSMSEDPAIYDVPVKKKMTKTEYYRIWRDNNRDKTSEYGKRYYRNHTEKCKQYQRDNLDKARENNRRYREKNIEKIRERGRWRYKENVGKIREYQKQWKRDNKYFYRAIAEQVLGRKIKDEERVHHIDMDHCNNDLKNLYVYSSNSTHIKGHGTINQLIASLLKDNIVEFKDGEYKRK